MAGWREGRDGQVGTWWLLHGAGCGCAPKAAWFSRHHDFPSRGAWHPTTVKVVNCPSHSARTALPSQCEHVSSSHYPNPPARDHCRVQTVCRRPHHVTLSCRSPGARLELHAARLYCMHNTSSTTNESKRPTRSPEPPPRLAPATIWASELTVQCYLYRRCHLDRASRLHRRSNIADWTVICRPS
jgi:hypothetical protein